MRHLPRDFVRASLPELASEICVSALDIAIASAAEGCSLVEAAARLRAISGDTAFAMKLMAEYDDT